MKAEARGLGDRCRVHLALLALVGLCSGCESTDVTGSSGPQGPPKSPLAYQPSPAMPTVDGSATNGASGAPDATVPAQFVRTTDSDEWVDKTIVVQESYNRLIVVTGDAGSKPRTVRVPSLRLNDRNNRRTFSEMTASAHVKTIQDAVDISRGGDLIAVMPGRHAGFLVGDRPGTGDRQYVRIVALGQPGDVVIDRAGREDPGWMVQIRAAHHIVIQGFDIAGSSQPGKPDRDAPRAGIFVDGDFSRSGQMAHHLVIAQNYSHHHRKWGFHSTDSHTVLMQDNVFALSGEEHCAYVSDGSDNYVIRRNIFFGSHASGLQINLDPHASLDELAGHPAMRSATPPRPTRAWAADMIARGNEAFGAGNFPDGRGVNFLIEENVVNQNGKAGAGAFNLAAMSQSLIQNNLLYGNLAHGIAQWDDGNQFDEASVTPGPATSDEARDEARLPLFGCRHNVVRNNTVLAAKSGRAALQNRNGSYGTQVYNNILLNDGGAALEVWNTSMLDLDVGPNVLGQLLYEPPAEAVLGAAKRPPKPDVVVTGQTRGSLSGSFRRSGLEPWILVGKDAGGFWKLNPKRPDYRPRPGSMLVGRADPEQLPPHDLYGKPRTARALGAFAP